jgi:hypothetical protein
MAPFADGQLGIAKRACPRDITHRLGRLPRLWTGNQSAFLPIPSETRHSLYIFRSPKIPLDLVHQPSQAPPTTSELTLCQRLLHASGVFGPPIKVDRSNTRLASFHTSGRNPLSGVRPESLYLKRILTKVSVSLSVQWADFFRSLAGESVPETTDAIFEPKLVSYILNEIKRLRTWLLCLFHIDMAIRLLV